MESYGAMVDAARAGGRAIPELWPLGTEALALAMEVSVLEAKRLGHRAVLRLSWLLLVASVALSTLLQVAVAPPTLVGYLTAGATPVWLLGSFAVLSLLYRADIGADPAPAAAEVSAEQALASAGPTPSSAVAPPSGAEVLTKRAQAERAYAELSADRRARSALGSWPPPLGSAPATPAPWSPSSRPDRQLALQHNGRRPARGRRAPRGRTMTAAAPADRAAASRLVAALEHAWTAIRSHHPDVPQVVIVVASGSDPRSRRLNLGHFAAGRWQLTNPDQPTDRPEVLVSGEGLQRGPVDVLGTLLHEAAHGLAHARKISDTSRQGRYHNRRYATLARELGLDGRPPGPDRLVGDQRPRADRRPLRRGAGRAGRGAGAVAPRRAGQPGRLGPVPQRPGLLLCLRPADPGGPLGAGAGPDPVRRLRPAVRARGRRGQLTRTRQ